MTRCLGRIVVWMLLVIPGQTRGEDRRDEKAQTPSLPVFEVTSDVTLDPQKEYGAIVIKQSGVTIDGRGAWLIGSTGLPSKDRRGIAIQAEGVSNVTLRGINAKGWESGLVVRHGEGWTVEECDFSDNFHDPEFGWGENGRRGGIVLEDVHRSTLKKNVAHRVWDACVLVDSHDNLLDQNDFSHASNTCLKLWTSCRNQIRENNLSYGIRISPGEVHARDSTSVLIESGSNDNQFVANDCTHGGDGIFVRVLNGWCSTGNLFEGNDCSYANNNGIECWAPRNTFIRNKANHCSYGFWLGGSDQSRLIENEASYNGLSSGHHNSPHLPDDGHAGIVFMFGPSSHTLARGNICRGNNGAGIALIGDLQTRGKKWKAYHWILDRNQLEENRWGVYAKHADWVVASANRYRGNTWSNTLLDGDVGRWFDVDKPTEDEDTSHPPVKINGPNVVSAGQLATWTVDSVEGDDPQPQVVTWDFGEGRLESGERLDHTFSQIGFQRIGVNVTRGGVTEPGWMNVYVVREVDEFGTESDASEWIVEDYHDRVRSAEQTTRASFTLSDQSALIGRNSLEVRIDPYAGFRAALTYPQKRNANWSLAGKSKLTFWLKAINSDVTGWQGGPFIVIHGGGEHRCFIEPQPGRDLMRESDHNEDREGWRLFEVPLHGDDRWKLDGELPETAQAVSLSFDSWGAPPLQIWIDGLAWE